MALANILLIMHNNYQKEYEYAHDIVCIGSLRAVGWQLTINQWVFLTVFYSTVSLFVIHGIMAPI